MQDYVGYRVKHRQAQKKKSKKLRNVLITIIILIVLFVLLGAVFKIPPIDKGWNETYDALSWVGRKIKSIFPEKKEAVKPEEFLPEGKKTANYLVLVTKNISGSTWLGTILLVSFDGKTKSANLLYFPNDLISNVPGLGMETFSSLVELDEDRASLAILSVENLLGIEIDKYVMGTDNDLSLILSKFGGEFELAVPKKVSFVDPATKARVSLFPGKQKIKGKKLVSYVTYCNEGQSIDLIERQKLFVREFLNALGKSSNYKRIPSIVKEYSNYIESSASAREMTGLLQTLVQMKSSKLVQVHLPVREFRYEKTIVHRLDQEKLGAFIKKYLKVESPSESRIRVEVLNGCGVPGISEKVASGLGMSDFQIVNTGNADNFEYPETLIIIYDNSKKMKAAAENVRNTLEVGKAEAHPRNQNLVDITIVVGKDYAGK
ncbi:MAG: LCP family protein [Actinomycetota bacterium]|nr:LCP family protein [Actinomycetota bacterium]